MSKEVYIPINISPESNEESKPYNPDYKNENDLEFSILDYNVEAFLNNVYYKNDEFSETEIDKYNIKGEILDKPIPVRINIKHKVKGKFIYSNELSIYYDYLYVDIDNDNYVDLTNLIPNTYYFYRIEDENNIIVESGVFKTKALRRFIQLPDAYNVRDLGGIKTITGHKIKFDKIFRGSELTQEDYFALSKGESLPIVIDLRNAQERQGKFTYYTFTNFPDFPTYGELDHLTDSQKRTICLATYSLMINVIHNKCVYINCVWGAHRTGLLSSIILNLLGVSQSDIDKDYELTSFDKNHNVNNLCRNDDSFGYKKGNEYIRDNYDGKWENFLIEGFVGKEIIEEFRKHMIEDYEPSTVFGAGTPYEYVTYNELVRLVNTESLNPGCKYRITDYKTLVDIDEEIAYNGTTSYVNITSDETPFDVIVTAISDKELDSIANIVEHDSYNPLFKEYDLSKFKIWYDIKNDKSKYGWAHDNGYGVIYRMIDDKRNDIPYDFLNIRFDGKYSLNNERYLFDGTYDGDVEFLGPISSYGDDLANKLNIKKCNHFDSFEFTAINNWIKFSLFTSTFDLYICIPIDGDINNYKIEDMGSSEVIYYNLSNYVEFIKVIDDWLIFKLNKEIKLDYIFIAVRDIYFHLPIKYIISPKKGLVRDYNISNTIIKPFTKQNVQHLNCNTIINSDDIVSKNIYLDNDCKFNEIIDCPSDIKLGSFCSKNKIENSETIELKESSVMNNIKDSSRIVLDSYNMYGNINNCKNINVEPYMYNLQLDNQGSTEEHIDVKQQESSIIIIDD